MIKICKILLQYLNKTFFRAAYFSGLCAEWLIGHISTVKLGTCATYLKSHADSKRYCWKLANKKYLNRLGCYNLRGAIKKLGCETCLSDLQTGLEE